MAKVHLLPTQALAGRVQADDDDADDWRFLRRPALLGLRGPGRVARRRLAHELAVQARDARDLVLRRAVAAGDDQSTSFLLFGLVAVYGGLVLLMRVWYGP